MPLLQRRIFHKKPSCLIDLFRLSCLKTCLYLIKTQLLTYYIQLFSCFNLLNLLFPIQPLTNLYMIMALRNSNLFLAFLAKNQQETNLYITIPALYFLYLSNFILARHILTFRQIKIAAIFSMYALSISISYSDFSFVP